MHGPAIDKPQLAETQEMDFYAAKVMWWKPMGIGQD